MSDGDEVTAALDAFDAAVTEIETHLEPLLNTSHSELRSKVRGVPIPHRRE